MKIEQIKETSLYVYDLQLIRYFYEKKLNFEVISFVENRHVFFRVGSSVLLCFVPDTTKNETNLPPHFAEGDQHIAFEVAPQDYVYWLENIKAKNIEVVHEQDWKDNLKSFYFRDPENNLLEIVPYGIWE